MASTTQTLAGWKWRKHQNDEPWHHCLHSKPTTEIFVDLVDAKRIPDPFLDQNELLVQWVGETDWEYECEFGYEPNAAHSRQDLIFEGLDTYASAFLNERLILVSSNMFHRHRINVKDVLQPGTNTLRIVFRSALREGRELESKYGQFRAFNGEGSRLHVRKAAYHYGWDWGPLLLSCGPYRDIRLESYSSVLYDTFVNATVADDLQRATLSVSWSIIHDQEVDVDVSVVCPRGRAFNSRVLLAAHETEGEVSFSIPEPELWFPVNHGPQEFHTVEVCVRSMDGISLHTDTISVGIRQIRLVQQPLLNEPGLSFFMVVNNQPVYISGVNYIPDHSFLTTLTSADYAASVDSCLQSNQNMMRVWGGGVYEHKSFYAECDRRGVMVWQDFMFACGQYPCYKELAESIKKEAVDQLKRLRNHCSIVLYAGNNEDYQVIESLGLEYDPNDQSGDWTETSFPARTIYETYLPAAIGQYCPNVPYHPGSPWGGKRTDDREIGDIHQWDVWHGSQQPYQLWDKLIGRFVSEFGMLAYPSIRSVPRFVTDASQHHPQSAAMELHNKAEGGIRRLGLYILENLRLESMSLESWTYASQLVQSECLAFAVRSCRRQWKGPGRELCGGQLVWQLNDCWPASSWGVIDFYGERKLAFYAIKRESAPLIIGIHRSTPELKKRKSPPPQISGAPHDLSQNAYIFDVWTVNTLSHGKVANIEIRLFDIQTGHVHKEIFLQPQALAANCSLELMKDQEVDDRTAVQAIMRDVQGYVIARASDWPQPLKHVLLPPSYHINLQVLNDKVQITSDRPVKALELYLMDEKRHVSWGDNGIDVFPGDVYVINALGLLEGDDLGMRYYGLEWVVNEPRRHDPTKAH